MSVVTQYFKNIIVLIIICTTGWVLLYRIVPPPATLTMLTRMFIDDGTLQYKYVPYHKISPYVKVCAMASEDQNLPFHYGIDIEAINKAIESNKKGKKLRGASTITQQVAKNVFLFPQRSFLRKGLELYFVLFIEVLWPKQKILEMYLNVAEMGVLIFGVEAAAQHYYKKPASQLNLNQSAAIISVLPNPRKYSATRPSSYVAGRQAQIRQLYHSLDGTMYLRELYVQSEQSIYDYRNYKK